MARVTRYRCMAEALADSSPQPVRLCGIGNVLDPLASRVRGLYRPGQTVREYVRTLWPVLSPGIEVNCALDGEYIGKDDWALARTVQPGQTLVVSLAPKGGGGGGGGGKNIFATVAMLALAVVAPVIAPYIVGAIGITAASVGAIGVSIATSLVSTGIMVGGALLISAFVGTGASSHSIASTATSSTDDSPTWSDAPNPVVEGGPWPVIYGTIRMTPVTLGWFKEYDGEDVYLNWMGAVADHGVTSIDDIFINDNPLSFYDNVSVERRLGTLDQEPISFFGSTVSEKSVNMRLSTDYVTARTDGNTCQGLGFILCFPQGLAYVSDSGSYAESSVAVTMQYRRVGDTDWVDWQTVTITGATGSALYKQFRADHINADGAQYDLRVKFASQPSTAARYRTMCYFAGIQEIVYDQFSYPGRALFGLRIKANDLLNNSTSLTVECVVTRATVQVFDGTSWSAKDASLPAWAAWDFQHNEQYGGCTPTKRIIYEDFAAWAEWLETMPLYRVNICMDSVSTHQSWMEQIAMLGRGAVVQIGSKFTCIVDRPVDTPSGGVLFGVGNILKDTFEIKYLSQDERANCIEVTYKDKDSDYSKQTLSWYGEDYDTSPEQTKTTQVTLLGCTSTEQALMHAEYLLKKNRFLTLTATFGAALNSLGVLPGDVIPVGHDLPQWGYGGRVVAATDNATEGATTATVTIDRDVTMEPGTAYAFQVQTVDDQFLEYPLVGVAETTTTRTLIIDGGWHDNGMPQRYDPYQFGPCKRVSKLFKVLQITQTDDFTASLECVEYNVGCYDDTVTVPTVVNSSSLTPVTGLVASEAYTAVSGVPIPRIDLTWRGESWSWQVYFRVANSDTWTLLGTTSYPFYTITADNLSAGTSYDFKVVARGVTATTSLSYQGAPTPPDITGLFEYSDGGYQYLTADTLSWPYILTYEVRKGADWKTATFVGSYTTPLAKISGPGTYWMAAKCGPVYSDNPQSITITTPGLVDNVIASWDEMATGWSGSRSEGLDIVGDALMLRGCGDLYGVSDLYALGDLYTIGGVVAQGVYQLPESHRITLATEAMCRVSLSVNGYGAGVYQDLYAAPDLYALPDLYGWYTQYVSITPQIRIYRDGAWTDWMAYQPGYYYGSAFDARLVLTSSHDTVMAVVSSMEFAVDVPDRVETQKGVTIPADGLSYAYDKPFNAVPTTVVQLLDAVSGDIVSMPSDKQTVNGYFIQITNNGTSVARACNIITQGY